MFKCYNIFKIDGTLTVHSWVMVMLLIVVIACVITELPRQHVFYCVKFNDFLERAFGIFDPTSIGLGKGLSKLKLELPGTILFFLLIVSIILFNLLPILDIGYYRPFDGVVIDLIAVVFLLVAGVLVIVVAVKLLQKVGPVYRKIKTLVSKLVAKIKQKIKGSRKVVGDSGSSGKSATDVKSSTKP
jgi:hypothetical protein